MESNRKGPSVSVEPVGHTSDPSRLQIVTPDQQTFKMFVDPAHQSYYQRNGFEGFTARIISAYTKPNGVFVDVGAHYGYYSLLVGSMHRGLTVYAFEPAPGNYAILRRNFELNGLNLEHVYNAAISDTDRVNPYQITTHSSHCGFYKHPLSETVTTIPVRSISLDEALGDVPGGPTMIKIDTEGHELCVLAGMKNILAHTDDLKLVVEFNPSSLRSAGSKPEELLVALTDSGFDIHLIDDERAQFYRLAPESISKWDAYFGHGNFNKNYFNILCVRKRRSLSVCFVSHSSGLAGAEKSLLELTRELIVDHGAVCTVALPNDGPLRNKLDEVGASTLVLEYSWWSELGVPSDEGIKAAYYRRFALRLAQMKSVIEKIDPDVVFTNSMVIPWGGILAAMLGKPHVWFVHEFGVLDFNLRFYQPFEEMIQIIRDSSDLIFTNSQAVKTVLFGPQVDEKIHPIRQYVAVPSPADSANAESYFRRMAATKLAVVGHIAPHKGQEDAILAVRNLVQRGIDIELLIVGSAVASHLERLTKIVYDEDLARYVQFRDYQEEIFSAIAQADILLTCAKCEAFGRVTLEAMLLRKAIVGTNTGGTPELIQQGVTGFLYEPGDQRQLADHIEFLIKNKRKMQEFGEAAYAWASANCAKDQFGGRIYPLLLGLKSQPRRSVAPYLERVLNQVLENYARVEKEMLGLQAKVHSQAAELDRIHASLGWRLLCMLKESINRLLPSRSWTRKVYDRFIKGNSGHPS